LDTASSILISVALNPLNLTVALSVNSEKWSFSVPIAASCHTKSKNAVIKLFLNIYRKQELLSHDTYFLIIHKTIYRTAKLTPANNMRVQAVKGANLPSVALGEGGFLFLQYIVKLERKQVF